MNMYTLAAVLIAAGILGYRIASLRTAKSRQPRFPAVRARGILLSRRARVPFLDAGYLDGIALIRERWTQIRDEALALHEAGGLDATTRLGPIGRSGRGLRAICRCGWEKFVLTWQRSSHRCARRLCPETVSLLERVPGIHAAMLCVLPADTELSLPPDPRASTLRYHLGLATPDSDRCFISVDGTRLRWRNGEDFVLDEAFPYVARNGTDEVLLMLICEVERPAGWLRRRLYDLRLAMQPGLHRRGSTQARHDRVDGFNRPSKVQAP